MKQKVEGVVIRTTDYGETHKVITVMTKELGKIGVMARGVKKPKSKLSACSQVFIYGQFLIHRRTGLGTLVQADVTESMRGIREDIEKTAYASLIIELTDKVVEDRSGSPELYNLLYKSLRAINEGKDGEVIMFIYQMKMLDLIGIKPFLDGCECCGSAKGSFAFSIRRAGYLCHNCLPTDPYHIRISSQTLKILRALYYVDIDRLRNISVKEQTKAEVKNVLNQYYEEYSGLYLKSLKFLSQIHAISQ